jgi:hypothetical protein
MKKLNIVNEGTYYGNMNSVNVKWVQQIGPIEKINLDLKYLCTGYMGGSPRILQKTLQVFLQQHIFGIGRHDQGAFNYLNLTGAFAENGIYTVDERPNEEVRHVPFVRINRKEVGYITCINNESAYATVIHHYYMSASLKASVTNHCPKEYPDLEDYVYDKWSVAP